MNILSKLYTKVPLQRRLAALGSTVLAALMAVPFTILTDTKQVEAQWGSSASFTSCANEGATCSFTGTRVVQFGTAEQFVSKSFSNSVLCTSTNFDGIDPAFGQAKSCKYSSLATGTGGVDTGAGQAPTPAQIAGKPLVGRIVAVSNQVIENVHITTKTDSCIVIPQGVTNVTIRNSEIGPCGYEQLTVNNEGVRIYGSNVTVQSNVIHDVSAAVTAFQGSQHPIVMDRNYVYNIRGPSWQGNIVQYGNLRGGTGQSKITCNVKDGEYRPGLAAGTYTILDHVSLYNSLGTQANPIEVAYNRILGDPNGTNYESGSGMQTGDGVNGGSNPEAGWYYVHHNTIVRTNGVGIGIAGGHDITVSNNIVDNRAPSQAWNTGWPFAARNFSTNTACVNHAFTNNRATIANLWAFNHDGSAGQGIYNGGGCTYSSTGNNFNDAALNAQTYRQIFDTVYTECGTTTPLPDYSLTQIYPLLANPPSTPAGKNITLDLRFYGRPMTTNVKPSLRLYTLADAYAGELTNHYWTFPAATWNKYTNTRYTFVTNIDAAQSVQTYKIALALYRSTDPYTPYFDQHQCNGAPLIAGTHCDIGRLTVTTAVPPADTSVTTDPQNVIVINGTTWSP